MKYIYIGLALIGSVGLFLLFSVGPARVGPPSDRNNPPTMAAEDLTATVEPQATSDKDIDPAVSQRRALRELRLDYEREHGRYKMYGQEEWRKERGYDYDKEKYGALTDDELQVLVKSGDAAAMRELSARVDKTDHARAVALLLDATVTGSTAALDQLLVSEHSRLTIGEDSEVEVMAISLVGAMLGDARVMAAGTPIEGRLTKEENIAACKRANSLYKSLVAERKSLGYSVFDTTSMPNMPHNYDLSKAGKHCTEWPEPRKTCTNEMYAPLDKPIKAMVLRCY